jgi:hypothetical protein
MRLIKAFTIGAAMLAVSATANAQQPNKYDFAIIGDAPYGPATGTGTNRVQVYPSPAYERMIAHINAAKKPEFVIHVGDIKEGNSRCDDNVYTVNREYFNTFQMPSILVPGDNEWTDCHRPTNGSYDPLERLAFLRTTFYPSTQTLGAKTTGCT